MTLNELRKDLDALARQCDGDETEVVVAGQYGECTDAIEVHLTLDDEERRKYSYISNDPVLVIETDLHGGR